MLAKDFRRLNSFSSILCHQTKVKMAWINLISFSGLLAILITITDPRQLISHPYSLSALVYMTSPLLWGLYFYSVLGSLLNLQILIKWITFNKRLFILICIGTILIGNQELLEWVSSIWASLFLQPTLNLALFIALNMGLDAKIFPYNSPNGPIFGTSQFHVEIWPACTGYEGMILIVISLAAYFYFQRNFLRLYRVFIIIPAACLTMFFLNAARIAILIAIGHFYSPQLALDGFHVVGGWINLLIVLILALLALNNIPYFLKGTQFSKYKAWEYTPFLLPLALLIAGGIVSKIFESEFPWLYPIPIAVTFLSILYFRKTWRDMIEPPCLFSFIIGAIVFLFWIILVPIDEVKNQNFLNQINNAPLGITIFWLICRIIGASIIVPIAEELAFRGLFLPNMLTWLYDFLTRIPFKTSPKIALVVSTLVSLTLSSILFGILHTDLLAGSIAGLGFGIAFLYRRKLVDAIVAHAFTNGLLVIDVVYFGNWAYW
jgi:exosortase E/protease (VPEID-CTERM system)